MVQLPEAYTMKNSLLWLIMGLYDQWFTNLTVNYVYILNEYFMIEVPLNDFV